MVQLLGLPRELRDMIYVTILTATRPQPTLGEAQWLFRFRRILEPQAGDRGEYGCAYSLESTPKTCANFLVCNRQIHLEMSEIIARYKKKGQLNARLDCIAEDESFHYFTWLGIPLVSTHVRTEEGKSRIMPNWADRMIGQYLTCSHKALSSGYLACRTCSTSIQQLWIDVRLVGDRSAKWIRNSASPERTSWAICAALKRILYHGPDFAATTPTGNEISIDELILNVVTPPNTPADKILEEDFPVDGEKEGIVNPKTVARELVDVWNKIWRGEEFRGSLYCILLERVKRVQICVDGESWKFRDLRTELERGQRERRRIAARVGW